MALPVPRTDSPKAGLHTDFGEVGLQTRVPAVKTQNCVPGTVALQRISTRFQPPPCAHHLRSCLRAFKGRPVGGGVLVNNVEVFKTALRNTGWRGGEVVGHTRY